MELVALHGFANTPAQWDAVAAALPTSIRLRALPLPGHVGGPAAGVDWQANVAALAATLPSARVPWVIGYSLGARLALALVAAGHAERALLIGVHPGLQTDRERAERQQQDARWAELLRVQGIAAFSDAWLQQPVFASQQQVAEAARAARRAERLRHAPTQLALAMATMSLAGMPNMRASLATQSTQLIVGANDNKFRDIANALVAATPSLRLHVVADSGHDPTLEAPVALSQTITNALHVYQ
jgi:2-succinyl-6-hydroxy-2,4-cyclohexadiene-1-carboxylate synthase